MFATVLFGMNIVAGSACAGRASVKPSPIEESAVEMSEVPGYQYFGTGRVRPMPAPITPQHPHMAPNGRSSMHADAYSTNIYEHAGPSGSSDTVQSVAMGRVGGECPHVVFDRKGRAITVCMHARKPVLHLMQRPSLDMLATHPLPARETPLLDLSKAVADTSGGAYFYLDQEDHVVLGSSDQRIVKIGVEEDPKPHFEVLQSIDVSRALRFPDGGNQDTSDMDRISAVMPDWAGRYWFAGRYGTVGTVLPDGSELRFIHLDGEEIENSLSVGPEGVYIVSDHALYRFETGPDGTPIVVWRETYDRGSRRKVGQVNQGSGTTPTLIGDKCVAITDNAEPQMHLLVFHRREEVAGSRLYCQVALFEPDHSAAENNPIAIGESIIVENNADYELFTKMRQGRVSASGVSRVDLRPGQCELKWTSQERSQTTLPKLSTKTGLVYLYTKLADAPNQIDAYYFTGIDFRTGKTVFRMLAGTGSGYDNNWAAISLAPDGSAFVGVLNGLVRFSESPRN